MNLSPFGPPVAFVMDCPIHTPKKADGTPLVPDNEVWIINNRAVIIQDSNGQFVTAMSYKHWKNVGAPR